MFENDSKFWMFLGLFSIVWIVLIVLVIWVAVHFIVKWW